LLSPGAGKLQVRTWLSMHFATTGSSPFDEVFDTVPFGATVALTVTLTLDF
jgi:hypothetical protein